MAGDFGSTLHSSALRLGDPDLSKTGLCVIILWKLHPGKNASASVAARLTPQWAIAPNFFIPIGRCHAKHGSLISTMADGEKPTSGESIEHVAVGNFKEKLTVDAFSWGSLAGLARALCSPFLGAQGGLTAQNCLLRVFQQIGLDATDVPAETEAAPSSASYLFHSSPLRKICDSLSSWLAEKSQILIFKSTICSHLFAEPTRNYEVHAFTH